MLGCCVFKNGFVEENGLFVRDSLVVTLGPVVRRISFSSATSSSRSVEIDELVVVVWYGLLLVSEGGCGLLLERGLDTEELSEFS